MKRIILSLTLALVLLLVPASGAFAATSQTVTVTAIPSFISIANSPDNWTVNGIDGNSRIATSTTYYANPTGSSGDVTAPQSTVVDGDCYFTITNTSTVTTNITANWSDFTGGDAMTNSNTGSATATSFGAYVWISGMTYATGKVIAKSSGSDALKSGLAASTNLLWGATISTRTNAWTSGSTQTSTITLTATAS